jgi:8-oxo-dGTP pyrophosphatase MutT (NUDIX family)
MKPEKPTEVATAVPYSAEKDSFLLAKRTEDTDIYPGKWNFPGGHIRKPDVPESSSEDADGHVEDEQPSKAALRELKEETGLKGQVLRTGESFVLDTVDGMFRIHPFLILVEGEPELNEEHTEYEWIEPSDLEDFETVKGLDTDLEKLDVL